MISKMKKIPIMRKTAEMKKPQKVNFHLDVNIMINHFYSKQDLGIQCQTSLKLRAIQYKL